MNCKQGDLAFVVGAVNPQNLMKIVEVLGPYDPATCGIVATIESRQLWLCESRGSELIWGDLTGTGFIRDTRGPIPDECLKPIKPPAGDIVTSGKTEQPAPSDAAAQHM